MTYAYPAGDCRYSHLRAFDTEAEAIAGAIQGLAGAKGENIPGFLTPFWCPDRDHWHLTSPARTVEVIKVPESNFTTSDLGPKLGDPRRLEGGTWWFGYKRAKDIPDELFLEAIRKVRGKWGDAKLDDIRAALAQPPMEGNKFPGVPRKVLLAKARRLLDLHVIRGCACGCVGNFKVMGEEFQGYEHTENIAMNAFQAIVPREFFEYMMDGGRTWALSVWRDSKMVVPPTKFKFAVANSHPLYCSVSTIQASIEANKDMLGGTLFKAKIHFHDGRDMGLPMCAAGPIGRPLVRGDSLVLSNVGITINIGA